MSRAPSTRRTVKPPTGAPDVPMLGDGFEVSDDDLANELEEETGIDLTDASELDADNVPIDEEFDRVRQAPD
ncbi:hypothetical protein WKW80_02735 [Variovorax humicola]|uniref:Uncharacterized protein n=1 Tax=Variovorax humicola TaxID=1769758 RepID=A0ABU8VT41_9BURK